MSTAIWKGVQHHRGTRRTRQGIINAVGFLIGLAFILPIYWLVITSLSPTGAMGEYPPPLAPTDPTGENYSEAFTTFKFGHFLVTSAVVCVTTTVLVVVLGSAAAYALSRTRMRAKVSILVTLLVISTFPAITVVAPLYAVFRSLGILNSYAALIIPYTALNLPFAIWLLRNYFLSIPFEIEEAGQLDGASWTRIIVQLVGPQALPGIFVAATLTFVASWQEFLMALTFNSSSSYQTAPVGIALMTTYGETPFGTIFAASTAALVPIVVVVFFMRRWITGGGAAGAVKG